MSDVLVRLMQTEDAYYVGTCSHVHESAENDAGAEWRLAALSRLETHGGRTLVALRAGSPVGFCSLVPIELAASGPLGAELMVIPCLWVPPTQGKAGAGRALMEAAERETQVQGRKGLCVQGLTGDFWFMPAGFFQHLGYTVAAERNGAQLLWKTWGPIAEPPRFMEPAYVFKPVAGQVAIDLFYSDFCPTSGIEARRVREVAAEFGAAVALREYCADDPQVRARYGLSRAIYVDGQEIGWGYQAPREGIRAAIEKALQGDQRA